MVKMDQLRARIEAVDGDRGKAFAEKFIIGQRSLAEQAKTDRKAAVRRARQARRCCALLEGLGDALAAYPDHWLRVLESIRDRLTQAITVLQKVVSMPAGPLKDEVTDSEKLIKFVISSFEMVRVARFVLSSAADALLGLVLSEKDGLEGLAKELEQAVKEAGIPYHEEVASSLDYHPVPSFEDIRLIIADCPEAISLSVDPGAVCNVCLIPLAVAKKLGVTVTYFSGAAFFAPCCNLWLNIISLEVPRPEVAAAVDDSFF